MLSRQGAILAALRRAKRFLTDFAARLASEVDLSVAQKRLDEVITNLSAHALEQEAHNLTAKGETEKQRQLRLKLRKELMKPIVEVARQDLSAVPEFKALQMPARSKKGESFVASASAMANAAELHKEALLERGLPADFLDQFKAGLATMTGSVSDRSDNHAQRQGATKGLKIQERQGRILLKVLDALVLRAVNGDAALLATWQAARTISSRTRGAGTASAAATSAASPKAEGTGGGAGAEKEATPAPVATAA